MRSGANRYFEPRNRREAIGLVIIYTSIAILVALVVTYVTNVLTDSPMWPSMARALVIPLLLAPWMIWTIARFALRLEAMRQMLEELALTDPLSGALNRRGIEEFARDAFAAQRP
jgi:hypothetical protein